MDTTERARLIRAGDRRALARAITLVESARPDHRAEALALIDALRTLPGLGKRSAERIALHLLSAPEGVAFSLSDALRDARNRVSRCSVCRNLTDQDIRVHTSYLKDFAPLPGRNLAVGVRVAF